MGKFKNSKGITLTSLIIAIVVMVILATIVIVKNREALTSMSEATFKNELRGMSDRLKMYHENATLEEFKYKKNALTWNGTDDRATNTGKVEDAQNGIPEENRREDTAEFIFGGIPDSFKNKATIVNGKLVLKSSTLKDEEKVWAQEMEIENE